MNVIFYGAGKYAKDNYFRWVSEGYNPVCFVDINKALHHTFFTINGIAQCEILPLYDAILKYPNTPIYISSDKYIAVDIRSYLLEQDIPENRISHPDYEWRMGCHDISMILFTKDSSLHMRLCCGYPSKPLVFAIDNVEQAVHKYQETIEAVITSQRNQASLCADCGIYSYGYYSNELQPLIVGFGEYFKGDKCPYKCIYCCSHPQRSSIPFTAYDIILKIEQLLLKQSSNKVTINITNAEPLQMPDVDKFLDVVERNNCNLTVATTGLIYIKKIKNICANNTIVHLTISLDAGTSDTYSRVKQQSAFKKVLSNIDKYLQDGVSITLKYILLKGINDNIDDIDGFIDICKQRRLNFLISRDKQFMAERMSQDELNAFNRLILHSRENGLNPVVLWTMFNIKDVKYLQKKYFLWNSINYE